MKKMDSIKAFLIEEKKQTYANGKAEKVSSSRNGSKDYEYKKENMIYHDTYFGGTSFIGEETVYLDHKIVWAMNYYGVALNKTFGEEAMDKVLRPALMLVGKKNDILPVRGPKELIQGEYRYTFETDGNLDYFSGIESIYKNGRKIYELKCTGGLIQ